MLLIIAVLFAGFPRTDWYAAVTNCSLYTEVILGPWKIIPKLYRNKRINSLQLHKKQWCDVRWFHRRLSQACNYGWSSVGNTEAYTNAGLNHNYCKVWDLVGILPLSSTAHVMAILGSMVDLSTPLYIVLEKLFLPCCIMQAWWKLQTVLQE